MLIFPSEQSQEAGLEPQKAVSSLVRQGQRERKGDPYSKPAWLSLSALLTPTQPALERVRCCRTRGKPAKRKTPNPHFCCQPNLNMRQEDRCCSSGWALCYLSPPLPTARPGCQATARRTSRTTGLRDHHLSSEEGAACAASEGDECSFAQLRLAITSAICQHSLCCIAVSQYRNGIVHPSARHTYGP